MSELKAMTVVETPAFIAAATRCLSEEEKHELIGFLAFHPEHGVLVRGTGGVRKLRWAVGSKGKSGGVRVIYFAHSEKIPLSFDGLQEGAKERSQRSRKERHATVSSRSCHQLPQRLMAETARHKK